MENIKICRQTIVVIRSLNTSINSTFVSSYNTEKITAQLQQTRVLNNEHTICLFFISEITLKHHYYLKKINKYDTLGYR